MMRHCFTTMIHERVDIEHWKAMFPLAKLREEARDFVLERQAAHPEYYADQAAVDAHIELMGPGGEIITSPHDIAVVELVRKEVFAAAGVRPEQLRRVETDVFIFGRGEPHRREVTKGGGLPYWPASRDWPTNKAGQPLTFVLQFCFADSRDLCPTLPGDVLLAFADSDALWAYHEGETPQSAMQFHWLNLGESSLIDASQVPTTCWEIPPCYGALHRTWDYPDAGALFGDCDEPWRLYLIEGTKIGGVPHWVQEEPHISGEYLCASGSISPASKKPFPWVNVPEPITGFRELYGTKYLSWGDAGSLYLSLTPAGGIRWEMQGY